MEAALTVVVRVVCACADAAEPPSPRPVPAPHCSASFRSVADDHPGFVAWLRDWRRCGWGEPPVQFVSGQAHTRPFADVFAASGWDVKYFSRGTDAIEYLVASPDVADAIDRGG